MFHNAKRLLPNEVVLDVGKQRIRSCAVAMYSNHGQVGLAARNVVVVRATTLELLDEVPDRETFHQADMLFEGYAI
ncbi:MAG: hypothetical protein JOZ14_18465 [Acidobacteria bacterium]|nr:hypothetical protein [Acidobacteriota bacterium]